MPWKDGSLTKGEQAFAIAFADHGDRAKAEEAAGLTPGYGYKVLLRPEVQREIRAREEAKLLAEGLPVAVQGLIDVITSPKSPAASRVAAAKVILDRTLGQPGETPKREIHEMTSEEIAATIASLEGVAAGLAKPVNVPEVFD